MKVYFIQKLTKIMETIYFKNYRKDSDDLQSSADVYFVDNIVLYKKLLIYLKK